MPHDPKPTPPSGMPTASLLDRATPHGDEISASKSDATVAILAAIEGLRKETQATVGALRDDVDRRFEALEREARDESAQTARRFAEQADAITSIAKACATAANMALEAKRETGEIKEDSRRMIESAFQIHRSSIVTVVESSVKSAISPIAGAVEELAKREEAASSERAKTNEAVGAIVNEIGLEDQVQLGSDVRPNDPAPKRLLKTTARDSKAAAYGSALAFVVIVIEIAVKLLGH